MESTLFEFSAIHHSVYNPGLTTILFTVVSSLILGILIAFTYERTSRGTHRPNHFLQAVILITIVAATIMQAIGDSVARGLGMLGALSIIRFRITVRDARNIVFVFSAIAAGIACGVLGFTIAFIGTLALCATAFLLAKSPFGEGPPLVGVLLLDIPVDYTGFGPLNALLNQYCEHYSLLEYKLSTTKKREGLRRYRYELKLHDSQQDSVLLRALEEMMELRVISFSFHKKEIENI